jgi:RimJ/RimL family protein N-acetyltransferase
MTAGLDFARSTFAPPAFRATVAAFNKRALRLCQKAGFQVIGSFDRSSDGNRFVILLRKA